ncbi:hypothetical protein LSCM1_04751 [Leishmania martiniquensis]|uniref:Uncharacterized protein n=1 Tax=Leishmania martiniquensis TaxID=1580590 RepID=A0A836GCM0_9TRYP|nr:hypothetical protein LSCM1_04751 [Leishmania martiniquensis]
MSRVPVRSRGERASVDPHGLPLIREEQRASPSAPTLGTSMSLAPSTILGRRRAPSSGTRTATSLCREGSRSSNILSRMVTHATRATAPWGRGQQPTTLQAPPRLAPLPVAPIVERGFGRPPTALAPLALAERSEEALCARRPARVAAAAAGGAGAGAICVCSARSALPLLPLSTATTATHRGGEPEPVWRRSKPLSRPPATTQGRTLSHDTASPDNVKAVLSNAGMPEEEARKRQGAEAVTQRATVESADGTESALCHADDHAMTTQTECVDSFLTMSVATESSQATLRDPQASPAGPSQGAFAPSHKWADRLVMAPVGDARVKHTREGGAGDFSTLSSSARSTPGHLSSRSAHSSECDVLWAHERPEQPAYAHKHQLPTIFSSLVQELLVAKPKADVDGDDDPLERWIQSWFRKQCVAQPQPHRYSAKHLRELDEGVVGATVTGAYSRGARSSNRVEPQQRAAAEDEAGEAAETRPSARPAAGPSTTGDAASVAPATTAMPASASVLQTSTAASPPHRYTPLTVECVRSGLQSRMTSGASQRADTPQRVPQTRPPPLRPAALHSAGANSSPRPPPNGVGDGSGGVLVAVAGLPPPCQQLQQPPPPKPLSGGPHFTAPPSARSMSSKQAMAAAAALAGSGESDKGASGIRTKLATTAYAVLVHSSSSSAAKEAAHPHE